MGTQGPSDGHSGTKGWALRDQGTGIYCPCGVHIVPKSRAILGHVILDRDVAELYGVETRDINKAVKNNPKKFPPGYVIELNNSEKQELVENFHRFNSLKHSTVAPHAFTEQGLYMLATILKGDLAISTTIAIIDTFTKLRKLARTIDKVNADAKEQGVLPDKATEGKIQTAMNEVFADNLPLKLRKLTFGVNLGVLKFSIETTRESKE